MGFAAVTLTTGPNAGKVLLIGGWSVTFLIQGPVPMEVASTELYDSASNSFASGPAMIAGLGDAMAITLNDGQVLVAGPRHQQTQLYDPIANTFTAGPSMNQQGACTATLLK